MDELRTEAIKHIAKGGSTDHLESLTTTKLPPFKNFPQYTYDELSEGKVVSFDAVEKKKRVQAGILTHISLNYCSLFTTRKSADTSFL